MVIRAALTETQVGQKIGAGIKESALPRLGQINFANCLPINLPIAQGKVSVPAEIVYATPSELNRSYSEGTLDLGAMSSYFYIEQADRLKLLPGLSISSSGPVGSVLLFYKDSPQYLDDARLEVPRSSATSISLVKILLQEDFGVRPDCVSCDKPDLDATETHGALVIGDRALCVDSDWTRRYKRVDLGEWWYKKFALPMVFGVWAARLEFLESHKAECKKVSEALAQALKIGLSGSFDEVKKEAAAMTGLPPQRFDSYFKQELNFELSNEHLKGLDHFAMLCRKHGL